MEAGDSRPGLNALAVWVDGRYLGDCYKQSPNKIEYTGCIGKDCKVDIIDAYVCPVAYC